MAIIIKNEKPPKLSADRLASIEEEMFNSGVAVQFAYDEYIADGMYPVLAATLATQRFANIGTTDKTFNAREHRRMTGMDEEQREVIAAIAKRKGVNTHGKTYNGALGKYGDPKAWVSGTHDVVLAAEDKGLSLRGMVNVENEPKKQKRTGLATDIVDRLELKERRARPDIDQACAKDPHKRIELREKIVDKHAPKKKK